MTESVMYQKLESEKSIATITMNHGKVNAFDHALFDGLNAALDKAEQDQAVVILTTDNPKIFSAGYDLKEMEKGIEAQQALVRKGSTFTRRLLAFPAPVIIASPGHAIAKGAFTLLSVDYRIGVEGAFKIGLNEIAIGMTMHHVGLALARQRLAKHYFHRAVFNAELFEPSEAVTAGYLDEVVSAENLMQRAHEKAEELAALDIVGHGQTKLRARKKFLAHLDWAIEEDANGSLFNE